MIKASKIFIVLPFIIAACSAQSEPDEPFNDLSKNDLSNCYEIASFMIINQDTKDEDDSPQSYVCYGEENTATKLLLRQVEYIIQHDTNYISTKPRVELCGDKVLTSFGSVEPDKDGNYFDYEVWLLSDGIVKISSGASSDIPHFNDQCEID